MLGWSGLAGAARRVRGVVAVAIALGTPTVTAGADAAARAYVLDAGAPALVSVDLTAARRVGTIPLVGTPTWLVQSEDGRFLVALDYGPGEFKGDRGYKATGRASATIVDAARFAVIGKVQIGFGLESVLTDPAGRLVVMTSGYDAKSPAEMLPRELVTIDLGSARELGRLRVEPGTDLTWQSPDGNSLALLQGVPRAAGYPFPQARVTLVDTAGPTPTGTLDASGWQRAMRDERYLYLIDLGKPDKNPQKNRNGRVEVVSFAERKVEGVDLGRAPTAIFLDSGQLVVASEGPPGGATGELRVLREGKLAATLPVATRPMYASPHGGAFCVVGVLDVTLVDPATLKVTATIPLAKDGKDIVGGGDRPFEVAVSPDRRRAFVHYPAQDKVAVLDLEQKKAIGSVTTGRGGKKFLNTMMAGLTYGMSEHVYYYNASDPPQMQVRADGRYAYALNLDTSDVTVIDAETAQAVGKIGAGGSALATLGSTRLAVLGRSMTLIDTEHNAKAPEPPLSGLGDLALSPDGAFAVALTEKEIVIFDTAKGLEHGRVAGFGRVYRIAYAKGGRPPSAGAPSSTP